MAYGLPPGSKAGSAHESHDADTVKLRLPASVVSLVGSVHAAAVGVGKLLALAVGLLAVSFLPMVVDFQPFAEPSSSGVGWQCYFFPGNILWPLLPWTRRPLTPANAARQGRLLMDGVLTEEECARMGRMYDMSAYSPGERLNEDWPSDLVNSLNLSATHDMISPRMGKDLPWLLGIMDRVQGIVDEHAGNTSATLLQSVQFATRTPSTVQAANALGRAAGWPTGGHGLHTDRCDRIFPDLPWTNFKCYLSAPPCCVHRTWSAVLWLNPTDAGGQPEGVTGGEFFFLDSVTGMFNLDALWGVGMQSTQPVCGRLVAFPSSLPHVHGVMPVSSGRRRSAVFWYTGDETEAVDMHWVQSMRGDSHALSLEEEGEDEAGASVQALPYSAAWNVLEGGRLMWRDAQGGWEPVPVELQERFDVNSLVGWEVGLEAPEYFTPPPLA